MRPEPLLDRKDTFNSISLASDEDNQGNQGHDDDDGGAYDDDEGGANEEEEGNVGNSSPAAPEVGGKKVPSELVLKISDSLLRKLTNKSVLEGISVDEYAIELLAEGLVLRAWEIIERKSHLSGQQQQGQGQRQNFNQPHGNSRGGQNQNRGNNFRGSNNSSNSSNNSNDKGGGRNFRRNGMSQNRYNSIMDDKAEFLEYVRAQERKNQR